MQQDSYVTRSCLICEGGMIYTTPSDATSHPEIASCPECKGTGECRTFTYPKPKGWRGAWPPQASSGGA